MHREGAKRERNKEVKKVRKDKGKGRTGRKDTGEGISQEGKRKQGRLGMREKRKGT